MPAGTSVVEAFNPTFSGTLVEGRVPGQPLDVLIAGDDGTAKETMAQLARDGILRLLGGTGRPEFRSFDEDGNQDVYDMVLHQADKRAKALKIGTPESADVNGVKA